MHLLSYENRSEFLAVPQLIRFEHGEGSDGFEPTLLIKGSTLLLKYVVLGAPMQLAFAMHENRLLYALKICDDGKDGGILWSVVERQQELDGMSRFAQGEPLVVFLFNEIAVNVAWNYLPTAGAMDRLSSWTKAAKLCRVDHTKQKPTMTKLLERLHTSAQSDDDWLVFEIGGKTDWKPLRNHFITAGASSSLIDIFDQDEGKQQEQIAVWLTDSLQPEGAYYSPQIPKGNGTRELTDILLSHTYGAALIESKTLSMLVRERLPDRAKLKRDVSAHIKKAYDQLRGAIRALKSNTVVTNKSGQILTVERQKPAHAIILVPDLELIDDKKAYGQKFMKEFMEPTGGFIHIMDISELLRVVQAAEMISANSNAITPMMAFDYYLVERAETAAKAGTVCIEVLLRVVESDPTSK